MVGTSFSCHIDCVKRQLQFRLLPTQPQLHLRFPAGGWGHWDKRLPVVALVDALDAHVDVDRSTSACFGTSMSGPTQLCSLFVLERLFRVVDVIGFDDQRDGNVFTVRPGLSDVLL